MKRLVILIFAFVMLISILLFQHDQPEDQYLKNIKGLSSLKLEGPEKSVFRDALMTMNPVTGEIPTQNIRTAIQSTKTRSSGEERDFQWRQVDTHVSGRTRSIMIDPNDPDKLWSGAVTGGLWYNPDFRNNDDWVPVSDDWESLSISSMTFDPNNTDVFYVGTGESFTSVNIYRESSSNGVGIYKSEDGGSTWTLLSSTSEFQYVNDIVIRDEDGSSVIYAGVASGTYQGSVFGSAPSDGLFRSEDGGITWEQVLPIIGGSSVPYTVSDIEIASNGDLFVGTMRNLALEGGGVILESSNGYDWSVEDRHVTLLEAQFGSDIYPGRVTLASEGDMVYAISTGGFIDNFNQIRDIIQANRIMYKDGVAGWEDIIAPLEYWANIPWHALAIGVNPENEDQVIIGALDIFALPDAKQSGSLSWAQLSDWYSMYFFSPYIRSYFGLNDDDKDSMITHFVHGDIHKFIFPGSADEMISATDGGVYYTNDLSKGFVSLTGERLDEYPSFGPINNSLATTQYYTIALHPRAGNNEILVGSQDNSTHTTENGRILYSDLIGVGDGAYCFFDSDDLNVRITSSQSNNFSIWIGDTGYFYGFGAGTFINPAAYDDRSNLLYTNMAVDGGFEALNTFLEGRYLDTLGIINVNEPLGNDMLGLEGKDYIRLGTNSSVAFSAFKISPYDDELDATILLGNQLGDVYLVSGLPYAPSARKIDNNQLPVGYISAVDIGKSNDEILVSFSNYGVNSVWYTDDGGDNWISIERDLPDIPVRDAKFNPLDSDRIMIATEVGIWGLESISDPNQSWQHYNEGLPNVRVDMFQLRAEDKTIALATHGRGAFLGTFEQGAPDPLSVSEDELVEDKLIVYPNPTEGIIQFNADISQISVFTADGREVFSSLVQDGSADISSLQNGLYFIKAKRQEGWTKSVQIIKK